MLTENQNIIITHNRMHTIKITFHCLKFLWTCICPRKCSVLLYLVTIPSLLLGLLFLLLCISGIFLWKLYFKMWVLVLCCIELWQFLYTNLVLCPCFRIPFWTFSSRYSLEQSVWASHPTSTLFPSLSIWFCGISMLCLLFWATHCDSGSSWLQIWTNS